MKRKIPRPETIALFRQVEGRIKAFAIWKGKRTQEWLARRGYPSGGRLDYHDLISESWRLLSEDPERTFASSDDLLRYFTGQISGLINNIRRSASARHTFVSIGGARTVTNGQLVIPEDDESLGSQEEYAQFENEMELQAFAAFVASKAPPLLDLLRLMTHGICDAPDQAARLHQTVQSVYKMRRELLRWADEFALNGANHD